MLKVWRDTEGHNSFFKASLHLTLNEKSVTLRRRRLRGTHSLANLPRMFVLLRRFCIALHSFCRSSCIAGFATIPLVHGMRILSRESLDLVPRGRLHYAGTTQGSCISDVPEQACN